MFNVSRLVTDLLLALSIPQRASTVSEHLVGTARAACEVEISIRVYLGVP